MIREKHKHSYFTAVGEQETCQHLTLGDYPKKSTGMGWVGFLSKFHGYFRVGYPKRLVILGSYGHQTRG